MTLQSQAQKPVNLLIINPSPRKIKPFEVKLQILNRKFDILREKYNFDEVDAYNKCRDYFLQHPEYTHLAIIPDDLLVDIKHVDTLLKDIDKKDYPVISGFCNFMCTTKKFLDVIACIPYKNLNALRDMTRTGRYDFRNHIMHREDLNKMKEENKNDRVIQVIWSAFPLTIIRRDVVEKIPFSTNQMGVDTHFFQQCLQNQIKTYADLDVELFHLKGIEKNRDLDYLINWAWKERIDTEVHYVASNPPKNEQIFLPKIE